MTEHNIPSLDGVRAGLRKIVVERDFSIVAAAALESMIASRFSEDERFDDLLHVLASYRPGGGEFLFDEVALSRECEHVLKSLG